MFTAKVGHKDVLGTDDKTSYFDYVQVVRTIAESFSRGLVSTVVFSAIFVTMVFAEWRVASNLTPNGAGRARCRDARALALRRPEGRAERRELGDARRAGAAGPQP